MFQYKEIRGGLCLKLRDVKILRWLKVKIFLLVIVDRRNPDRSLPHQGVPETVSGLLTYLHRYSFYPLYSFSVDPRVLPILLNQRS